MSEATLTRERRRPMPRPCAYRGCTRSAPRASDTSHGPDQFCTRHDGGDHGLGVCECQPAHADGDGQCTRCWHPIVSLHPGLAALAERFPFFAEQTFAL